MLVSGNTHAQFCEFGHIDMGFKVNELTDELGDKDHARVHALAVVARGC
jgi:hypothetical protein